MRALTLMDPELATEGAIAENDATLNQIGIEFKDISHRVEYKGNEYLVAGGNYNYFVKEVATTYELEDDTFELAAIAVPECFRPR
mgnify:CR=1 FL=1